MATLNPFDGFFTSRRRNTMLELPATAASISTNYNNSGLGTGNLAEGLAKGDIDFYSEVKAIPLTGYTSGAGTVAATDNVLEAIQKLNGNILALGGADQFVVANIAARNALGATAGDICFVVDASADALVVSGAATYVYSAGAWVKIGEAEAIDTALFNQITVDDIVLNDGLITFSDATGDNRLIVPDNLADALRITDGTQDYISIVSTTGSDQISLMQNTVVTNGSFVIDELTLDDGVITFAAATTANQILITDNLADALRITDGTQDFVTVTTTTGSDAISIHQATDFALGVSVSGATTVNTLTVPDNLADALRITDGTQDYLTVTSTTGADQVNMLQAVDFLMGLSFSGATTVNTVTVPDNLADAMRITDGTEDYMTITSTTGADQVNMLQTTDFLIGVSFSGATGVNDITLPTNLADALSIVDDAAVEFITLDSTTGTPLVNIAQPTDFALGVTMSGATTINTLTVPTNLADALSIADDAAVDFIVLDSTTGTPVINMAQSTDFALGINFSGATTVNTVTIPDNLADALRITDGTQNYVTITTTTGSDQINLNQTTAITAGSLAVQAGNLNVTGTAFANETATYNNDASVTTNGLELKTAREVHTLAAAADSATTTLAIPVGALIIGASFNVDTTITTSAAGDTWDADFITGSTTNIVAAGAAGAQNTKADALFVPILTTGGACEVEFDAPGAETFTAGVIEVVVYYYEINSIDDV